MTNGLRMPGVPEAQQDPVLKRYPLRRLRIPAGKAQLSIVVPDSRAWMRQGAWTAAVLRGKEPPYWCRVWPAAVAIARHLACLDALADGLPLRGLRVLDLGCGVGVPGIQAAAIGAELCSADFEPDAGRFAQWNAQVQPGCSHPPTTQHVDWSQGTVTGTFDIVLLSDVTYHETHHVPIRRQLKHCLAENGCVLHADPRRDWSTHFLDQLDGSFARHTWHRRTTYLEHDDEVRLTLFANTAEHLHQWRERLAAPSDLAAGPAVGSADPDLAANRPAVNCEGPVTT